MELFFMWSCPVDHWWWQNKVKQGDKVPQSNPLPKKMQEDKRISLKQKYVSVCKGMMFGFSIHLREKKQKDKILNVTLSSIYNSNDYPWHKKLCIWMGPMVIGQAYKIPRVEVWCLPGTIEFYPLKNLWGDFNYLQAREAGIESVLLFHWMGEPVFNFGFAWL